MREGITRARLEQVAQERGFTVQESHLDIYYHSLGRSYDETYLTVMDGTRHVVQFNAGLLEEWVPESYVVRELDAYKPPAPAELLSLRLPDGTIREFTMHELARYEGDWQVNLAHISEHELETGIKRLMGCIAHEDGVKCPVCGD